MKKLNFSYFIIYALKKYRKFFLPENKISTRNSSSTQSILNAVIGIYFRNDKLVPSSREIKNLSKSNGYFIFNFYGKENTVLLSILLN